MSSQSIAEKTINTIRSLSIDAIQKANSGHPGLPLGAAPMAYALWQNHLRHHPGEPSWPNRDRFVLSPGHGSALLYSLLHLAGYELSMDDLKSFRQWGAKTPGHPESFMTPGVEATTGPLGQGSANAVGMALAETMLAQHFNRPGHTLVDHMTYAIVSDGDLMEGLSGEAASLAGHLKLAKLVYLYDANDITLDGPTSLTFSGEDVCARYESFGWQVIRVEDGDTDVAAIDAALQDAKADTERPTLIWVHTTIGFGSPNKAGTSGVHGSPLGPDELKATKSALGVDPEKSFYAPDDVSKHFNANARGADWASSWATVFQGYQKAHPELAKEWTRRMSGELPKGWDSELPSFEVGSAMATRVAGSKVLQSIAKHMPELVGGDADLGCSTKTIMAGLGSFAADAREGRNIHYGVREHAMGAIQNGIAYHGGLRSFTATFFCFSDYMRPAVRLAALNGQACIYVWTHDSVGLGEDGPTHQPVEHLMSLRAMPNLWVIRPCDANETRAAWSMALKRNDGPTALVFSRQNLPVFKETDGAGKAERGAYILADGDDGILLATGSEVSVAMEARELLAKKGKSVRVVSMPCFEAFDFQSADFRESVLPSKITARVSVEAGSTIGWHKYVGTWGEVVGLDRFGASAPAGTLFKEFGFTAENVAAAFERSQKNSAS